MPWTAGAPSSVLARDRQYGTASTMAQWGQTTAPHCKQPSRCEGVPHAQSLALMGPGASRPVSSEWVRRRSEGARQASEGRGGRWELAVLVGGVLGTGVLRRGHALPSAGG